MKLTVIIALLALTACARNLPAGDCPPPLVEHPGKDNTSCIKPGMAQAVLPAHVGG